MLPNIKVNAEDLELIDKELLEACENYRQAQKELEADITKLTSGGLEGTLATDLLNKFEDKTPALEKIGKHAEEIKDFSKSKTRGFHQMLDETKRFIR